MTRIWSAAFDAVAQSITGEEAYWHACTNTPIEDGAADMVRRAVACERKFDELIRKPHSTWPRMEALRRLRNAATNYGAMAANKIGYAS